MATEPLGSGSDATEATLLSRGNEARTNAVNSARLIERLSRSRGGDGSLHPLLDELQSEDAKRDFTAAYGVDLPWVYALHAMERDESGAFIRLAALADLGTEQRPLIHHWIASLWDDAPPGLKRYVVDPEAAALCERAIRLHRDAAAGATIEARTWRHARSAMTPLTDKSPQGYAVGAVAASCWNPGKCPDVLSDVFHACWMFVTATIDAENGWRVEEIYQRLLNEVDVRLGPAPGHLGADWEATDEGRAWVEKRSESLHALEREPGGEYYQRFTIKDRHFKIFVNDMVGGVESLLKRATAGAGDVRDE